jgi:hypothetical protein
LSGQKDRSLEEFSEKLSYSSIEQVDYLGGSDLKDGQAIFITGEPMNDRYWGGTS